MSKRGMTLTDAYPAVLTFVLIGVLIAVGVLVLSTIMANSTVAGTEEAVDAVNYSIQALATFGPWLGIIALVIVAAIVIGVLIKSFTGRGTGA